MSKGGFAQEILREFQDQLPIVLPDLGAQEVARYVALGEEGWARLRQGDDAGARAAFSAQLAVFPGNPEPHVSLALLEAQRGDATRAVAHLRDAVVRGFTDMDRLERAEAWTRMRRDLGFEKLCWVLPALAEEERTRTAWSTVGVPAAPPDAASVLERHAALVARVEAMGPAIGERLVRLWTRKLDQSAAALLEAHVTSHPDAPDVAGALARLMTLYQGGGAVEWTVLPPEVANRMGAVAGAALDRAPEGAVRRGALACRALAANAVRDREGRLDLRAEEAAVAALGALAKAEESAYARLSATGLVAIEVEGERWDRARARFAALDPGTREAVRRDLGAAGLRVAGLPEFSGTALDGTTVGRETLDGTVAVLDFWATWCAPCVEEFPTLRSLAERHGEAVSIVGINLDRGEEITPEALREWVAREALPGHHLHDGLSWDSDLVEAFGVREIPFTVLVGRDGEVLAVGAHGRRLEKAVAAALKGDRR